MLNTYGVLGILQLIYFKIRTFFLFKNAKIIRFPIRIRGKKFTDQVTDIYLYHKARRTME